MTSSSDSDFGIRRVYLQGLLAKARHNDLRPGFGPRARSRNEVDVAARAQATPKAVDNLQARSVNGPPIRSSLPMNGSLGLAWPGGGRHRGKPFVSGARRRQSPQRQPPPSQAQQRIRVLRVLSGADQQNEANDLLTRSRQIMLKRYRKLFSFEAFPHVAKKIFGGLDSVSLMRCKLVCKEWFAGIAAHLEGNSRLRNELMQRWCSVACSIAPVTPNVCLMKDNPNSQYRNVIGMKCDESELILAIDNGNVEIYDRFSLRLTCVLSGSSSPTSLDCNSRILLVSYVHGFGRPNQKSTSMWNVFCRRTYILLRSIERNSIDQVRIGFEDRLFVTTPNTIFGVLELQGQLEWTKLYAVAESDVIEATDIDHANGFVASVVNHVKSADPVQRLMLHVWLQSSPDGDSKAVDFMTRLDRIFPLFNASTPTACSTTAKCLSVQLIHPLCLCLLSNSGGNFESKAGTGRPFTLVALYDVAQEECLRIVQIAESWMSSHNVVPFDDDSCVLTANFNHHRLVVGFGSFSGECDGGIAMWTMSQLLDPSVAAEDLSVVSVPAPTYHAASHNGHTGGVTLLHLDRYQLVAVNACSHRVNTRCIENGDEADKDNVLVYDFWDKDETDRRRIFPRKSSR